MCSVREFKRSAFLADVPFEGGTAMANTIHQAANPPQSESQPVHAATITKRSAPKTPPPAQDTVKISAEAKAASTATKPPKG
jgi:hypothetical protein